MMDFELEARLDEEAMAEVVADPEVRRLTVAAELAVMELKMTIAAMMDIKRPVMHKVTSNVCIDMHSDVESAGNHGDIPAEVYKHE